MAVCCTQKMSLTHMQIQYTLLCVSISCLYCFGIREKNISDNSLSCDHTIIEMLVIDQHIKMQLFHMRVRLTKFPSASIILLNNSLYGSIAGTFSPFKVFADHTYIFSFLITHLSSIRTKLNLFQEACQHLFYTL